MIWVVRCKSAGPDGGGGLIGSYRRKWRADLALAWGRICFPSRRRLATPVEESEWHPWRRNGRWVERRVRPPWFSADQDFCEQFRELSAAGPAVAGRPRRAGDLAAREDAELGAVRAARATAQATASVSSTDIGPAQSPAPRRRG